MAGSMHAPLKPISNGPKASATISQPSTTVEFTQAQIPLTFGVPCLSCFSARARTPNYDCESCRKLQLFPPLRPQVPEPRHTSVKPRQKIRPAAHHANTDTSSEAIASSTPNSSVRPRKRKAHTMAEQLAEPERTRSFTVTARKGREYQTQEALLDALASEFGACKATPSAGPTSGLLDFHGGCTVVLDPAVSPQERVARLVAENNRVFPLGNVFKREMHGAGDHIYSQHHWCICRGVAPVQPPPVPAREPTPPLPISEPGSAKSSQSVMKSWLAKAPKAREKGRNSPPGRGVCGGTVLVQAAADMSHPLAKLGVKGQRITIHVRHPEKYPS